MRLISGAPSESPQETHNWHIQKLQDFVPDPALAVVVQGKGTSPFKNAGGPLFHIPILGGWREYVVLEAVGPWHVGWSVAGSATINKLPLEGPVRLLRGLDGWQVTFFALDTAGNQIPITVVGEGRIGDGQHADVRLL